MFFISRLWHNLVFYWHTCNRGAYILSFAGILLCLSFVAMTHFAIQSSQNARQIQCLALNIYHEARGEPVDGQYAVAQVTMNRVASRHYPDSVCGVVFQKRWDSLRNRYVSAFSWTEIDPEPPDNSPAWTGAHSIATEIFTGARIFDQVEGALFYHARHIRPSWSRKKKTITKIGRHIFY